MTDTDRSETSCVISTWPTMPPRGVAIIESFTNTDTRDETQLQWLLQAAEDYRKRVPTFNNDALGAL